MKRSDRELLRDVLFMLDSPPSTDDEIALREEIRARLAEIKLEPRAWVASKSSEGKADALYWNSRDAEEDGYAFIEPLYSHPSRQPVRLSDEEIETVCQVWRCRGVSLTELVRDMESAFIEKNQ